VAVARTPQRLAAGLTNWHPGPKREESEARHVKILWLSHFLPYPPRGGALQRSYYLLRQAALTHEVHLVAVNNRAQLSTPAEVAEAVSTLSRVCARVDVFPNTFDHSRFRWGLMAAAGFWRSTPYDVNWLRHPAMRGYLGRMVTTADFDVVHVDTLGLMPYANVLPALPIVLNHHNIESHMMRRRAAQESQWLRRIYFRRDAQKLERCERTACRRAAVNVVVSALDAERLRTVVGDGEVAVVQNGVDLEYFQPTSPGGQEPEGLIFVGTMNWYPNREAIRYFLREIWPLLLADNPRRRLSVIGRDPPREVLAAARDGAVQVPGYVEDVRPYLAAAAIYVCPIRDGGGTRLKVLDALAMAKPLVATGLAVEGLDLVEEEHYLRAETPVDTVRQIRRLERDPDLSRRLAWSGRRLVEQRYSWEVIGARLNQAYQLAKTGARLQPHA